MNELSIFDAGVLQPWGLLDDSKSAVLTQAVPDEWDIGRTPAARRAASFDTWRHHVLSVINDVLWPRFDPRKRAWIGRRADSQFMQDLSEADLQLMHRLRHPEFGTGIFFKRPQPPLRAVDMKTHKDLFDIEDSGPPLDPHKLYDRTFTDHAALADAVGHIDNHRQSPINFWFKNELQRPRPMQIALRRQQMDFLYNIAKTSITPSMCSGHALQGTMCLGGSLEILLDRGVEFDEDRLETHGRWAVDFGDRRVMAGAHYPSDNLCSWLIFLSAAKFLFHRPEVWLTVGYAIRNFSVVYALMQTSAQEEPLGYPYKDALQTLEGYLPPKELTLTGILKEPAKWLASQP